MQRANFHLCQWPPGINKLQMLLRHSGNFACFDLKEFQRTGKVLRNPRRPTGKAPTLPSLKSLAAAIQPLPGAKRPPTSPMKMIPPPSSKKKLPLLIHTYIHGCASKHKCYVNSEQQSYKSSKIEAFEGIPRYVNTANVCIYLCVLLKNYCVKIYG